MFFYASMMSSRNATNNYHLTKSYHITQYYHITTASPHPSMYYYMNEKNYFYFIIIYIL